MGYALIFSSVADNRHFPPAFSLLSPWTYKHGSVHSLTSKYVCMQLLTPSMSVHSKHALEATSKQGNVVFLFMNDA